MAVGHRRDQLTSSTGLLRSLAAAGMNATVVMPYYVLGFSLVSVSDTVQGRVATDATGMDASITVP